MRRVLLAVLLAVIAVVAVAAPAGTAAVKRHNPPHCAVPTGWSVTAHNAQAVVIHKLVLGPDYPTISAINVFRYCARPGTGARGAGRFRLLVRTTGCCYEGGIVTNEPPTFVDGLTLSGRYVAFGANWYSRGGAQSAERVRIVNTHDATTVESGLEDYPSLHTLLLSTTGVAVWLWTMGGASRQDTIQSLVGQTGQGSTLDSAVPGQLGDLQLYQCVAGAGCSGGAPVVLRWTNAGEQREATVG
jgi:hypothetical protein